MMRFLNSLSLAVKLPAIIAMIGLLSAFSVAALSYLDMRHSSLVMTKRSFDVLTDERGASLAAWLSSVEADVGAMATSPAMISAFQGLSSSYRLLPDPAVLREAYITNNPYPAGERGQLDQAPDMIAYHFQHGAYHGYFRNIVEAHEYYDLFLIDPAGDVIYSYAKEDDFASNLATGALADSGLALAVQAAVAGAPAQTHFSDFAAYAPSGGAPAAFLASALRADDGALVGVLAVQLPLSVVDRILNNPSGLGETGQIYLVGADGATRSTSRFAEGFAPLTDVAHLAQASAPIPGNRLFLESVPGISGVPVIAEATLLPVFGRDWRIIGEKNMAEVMQPVAALRNKIALIGGCVMLLAALAGLLTARSVLRPLARLGQGMQRVANRDYAFDIPDSRRGDELGMLSQVLVEFREKLRASDAAEDERLAVQAEQARVVEALSKGMNALADGDLTATIANPFHPSYEMLRQDFNRTVSNLHQAMGSVVTSAIDIRDRANEMSSASDDLARRTENQAATLEQTAAAMDQLTASVRSAANGAREVDSIVVNARQDANNSEPVVQKAVAAMTAISQSSHEITQIVSVIDDIAFQTNLLALNAGVEAARAGDAGRGFAVVASEVRALAQRSSEAARQIKSLINGSAQQVTAGVSLVGQAGEALTKIARHISHISDLMSDIATGAQEQSTGLAEINIGVTQLDQVTQQNAAMVEQATASSHALNAEAASLSNLVARFRLRDGGASGLRSAPTAPATNVMMFQSQQARPRDVQAEIVPLRMEPLTGTTGRPVAAAAEGWEDF